MKKLMPISIQQTVLVFLLVLPYLNTVAQKLPATQQISLRAPDNVKIDGKATEWGGKYQAYNINNHLFYTIANDDKNLYLIVHSTDEPAIQKISRWGLALTICSSVKKKINDPANVSVDFPIDYDKKGAGIIRGASGYIKNKKLPINSDSLMKSLNTKIGNSFKLIAVSGIKGINESTISVYNTDGLKAVALFDDKIEYTYELAIPLKYLSSNINNGANFSYNIKLNGGYINPNGPGLPMMSINGVVIHDANQDYLFSPTDFWGEYALAKK